VFGVVHYFGDADAGHFFGGIRAQQGFQELRLEAVGLQPPLIMLRAENHRHPVVDGGDHRIGFGGDDGESFDGLVNTWAGVVEAEFPFPMRAMPFFPKAGHAKESAILAGEPERLFAGGCGLPFVKAIGGNQAALFFKRPAVAGFLGDGVGPGVGQFVADGFILRPGWNQTPPHRLQNSLSVFPDEDGGVCARGEVVARLEIHDLADEPDEFFQFIQIGGDGVATAHFLKMKNCNFDDTAIF